MKSDDVNMVDENDDKEDDAGFNPESDGDEGEEANEDKDKDEEGRGQKG